MFIQDIMPCLKVVHIMNVCLCVLCKGVCQYLYVRVELVTRCSGMRLHLNFGVRCTSLGPDPDIQGPPNSTTVSFQTEDRIPLLFFCVLDLFFEGMQVSVPVQLVP